LSEHSHRLEKQLIDLQYNKKLDSETKEIITQAINTIDILAAQNPDVTSKSENHSNICPVKKRIQFPVKVADKNLIYIFDYDALLSEQI